MISDEIISKVINNRASKEEGAEVARWFATPEGQKRASLMIDQDIEKIKDGRFPLYNDIPLDDIYAQIHKVIKKSEKRRILYRIAAILIPIVFIFGIGYNLNLRYNLFGATAQLKVATQRGERLQLFFQDGTKVFLNSNSKLTFPEKFGLSKREVHLDGEAYFEVAHNSKWPFVVKVKDAEVQVKGTSFDVNAFSCKRKIIVSLDKGKVDICVRNKQFTLTPNKQLIYDKVCQYGIIYKMTNRHAALWHENIISFDNDPLSEILLKLGEWYDVKFKIIDIGLNDVSLTFTSNKDASLQEVLQEIEMLAPIHFHRDRKQIEVYKK